MSDSLSTSSGPADSPPIEPRESTETQERDRTGAGPIAASSTLEHNFDFLGPPVQPNDLGTLGDYRITRLLGEGGMGFVFHAEDDQLRRPVALKVMKPGVAAGAIARDRFLREGRAAAALKSVHVVTIYQVGEANGVPFLAMEYLEGWPLDTWLKGRNGVAPVPAAVRIAKDVLKGLAAAHEKGMVHRDIKPANLWIEKPAGRVKVLDFGLTRAADGGDQVTAEGLLVGTPAYMAPEQGRGQSVDARADLFSLGVVLYRVLAGKSPFQRGEMMSTLTALATESPPPLVEIVPGVPADFSAFVERLMAKDPADRPVDTRAALSELAVIEKRLREAMSGTGGPASKSRPVLEATSDYVPAVTVFANQAPASTSQPVLVEDSATDEPSVPVRSRPKLLLVGGGVVGMLSVVSAIAFSLGRFDTDPPTSAVVVMPPATVPTRQPVEPPTMHPPVTIPEPTPTNGFPPLDPEWEKRVLALPPEQQAEEVRLELKRRNPDWPDEWRLRPSIFGGRVEAIFLASESLQDITPVRTLKSLRTFNCLPKALGMPGTRQIERSPLDDLSPLQGIPLWYVYIGPSAVTDLAPIASPSLQRLLLMNTEVSDLSPLRNCKDLKFLSLERSPVEDLTPIANCPIEEIILNSTRVTDLTPLKNTPLSSMIAANTRISDLSPLRGKTLSLLDIHDTDIDLQQLYNIDFAELTVGCYIGRAFLPKDGRPSSNRYHSLTLLSGRKFRQLNVHDPNAFDLSALPNVIVERITIRSNAGLKIRESAVFGKLVHLKHFENQTTRPLAPELAVELRKLPNLQTIDNKPVAEFWKEYDAMK